MKDHEGCIRGFILLSEAWYAHANLRGSDVIDEVSFGHYALEGGTTGEMSVRWSELGGKKVPKLECFDDGWHSLSTFTDLIAEMGNIDNENITPKDFCSLLTRLGFADMTPRKNPRERQDNAPKSRETILANLLSQLTDAVLDDDTPSDLKMYARNAQKALGRRQ